MLKLNLKFKYHVPLILLASAILAGCAAQRLHNNGMSLVQGGQVEEGLSELEQATKADPENLNYQKDLKHTREQILNRLLASASTEQSLGHAEAAQHIYERILKIEPGNSTATLALQTQAMNKRHEAQVEEARAFFEKGDMDSARSTLKPVLLENPKQGQAVLLQRQIDEQETKIQMAEPALNMQFKKPVTLQFRDANVKMVFEAISRASGINVLLDKDLKADLKTSIFVKDVSVEDAIDLILMQSQLEKKILSNNTVYIYPNTPAKLKDFQDLKIRSFHLVNADPKQILTMLKTLLKTKDIFIHEKTNSIVMRDTPDAIHLAEKMIADQDIADPEVMLEVEILEVNRAHTSDLGIQYPNQLTLSPIQSIVNAANPTGAVTTTAAGVVAANTPTTTQLTLNNLGHLNSSSLSVNVPTATLNAMMQDSDTNILSSPRLRVRNHEKAKIMIGDRVPIITNSITPSSTGPGVVTGTVTYQDVGLKLDVEPEIHLDNDVSIKIGLEVSSLGNAVTNSSTGSVVYTVQTRNTSTSLRLRDGETQILAGLVQDSDTNTVDKVPVLGQIPLLGYLFSNDNGNKSKKEIILSITPHVVGHSKLADAREMEYWSGTESELRSSQLVLKPLGTVNMGTPAPGSSATPMPAGRPAAPLPATQPATDKPAAKTPTPPAALQATPQVDNAVKPALAVPAISRPVVPTVPAPAATTMLKDKAVSNAPPMTLSWQGPKQAKVGEKISVLLNTPSTLGAKNIGFQIGFDPAVLKPVDVIEGDALKRNNAASNLNKNIDLAGGSISIEMSGTGSSGSASVIALTFEVISSAPESSITLDSTTATGTNGDTLTLTAPDPYVITVAQ